MKFASKILISLLLPSDFSFCLYDSFLKPYYINILNCNIVVNEEMRILYIVGIRVSEPFAVFRSLLTNLSMVFKNSHHCNEKTRRHCSSKIQLKNEAIKHNKAIRFSQI